MIPKNEIVCQTEGTPLDKCRESSRNRDAAAIVARPSAGTFAFGAPAGIVPHGDFKDAHVCREPTLWGAREEPLTCSTIMDIIRIILSVILPPLGVFLQVGLGMHFWLNILLTLLGYFPGLIHAIYIIVSRNPT